MLFLFLNKDSHTNIPVRLLSLACLKIYIVKKVTPQAKNPPI